MITVLLFGSAKSIISKSELQFDVDDGTLTPKKLKQLLTQSSTKSVSELFQQTSTANGTLAEWIDIVETSAIAVNQEYVENNWENDELKLDGKMEIALIPTVSGG